MGIATAAADREISQMDAEAADVARMGSVMHQPASDRKVSSITGTGSFNVACMQHFTLTV